MRQTILIVFLILTACSQQSKSGSGEYLLPWADEAGQFHLRRVHIDTLSAPDQVSGPAARVYYQPTFTDQGFSGSVARPQLTEANGVYIPQNVESAMALAVYANFERLQKFDNRILQSAFARSLVSWPRHIGIEVQLVDVDSGLVDLNNARYYGDQDVIALFPYTGSEIPLVLNSAILAHEHFHAYFHKAVLSNLLDPNPSLPKKMNQMDFSLPEDFNELVLRAWNEGLADFYSTVYTAAPRMISASLSTKGLDARNLDGEFSGFLSIEKFREQLRRGQWAKTEDDSEWCNAVVCAYRQGTQLARMLYQFSGDEGEMVMGAIINNLGQLSQSVLSAKSVRALDLDEVVSILLADVPLNAERCALLRRSVSIQTMQQRFSLCAQL